MQGQLFHALLCISLVQNYHWDRETLGRGIRMRLVIGTEHYKYLVRLGFPLPTIDAIDKYVSKIETEIEEELNSNSPGIFCLLTLPIKEIKFLEIYVLSIEPILPPS